MSYRDLEIFTLSMELFYEVHPLTLKLPKHEMYELGSQLRRSSDSIVSNIVEGYGRRTYKAEYIRFLIFAHSSNDETLCHIEKLIVLYPEYKEEWKSLFERYDNLGRKINRYIKYVRENWRA